MRVALGLVVFLVACTPSPPAPPDPADLSASVWPDLELPPAAPLLQDLAETPDATQCRAPGLSCVADGQCCSRGAAPIGDLGGLVYGLCSTTTPAGACCAIYPCPGSCPAGQFLECVDCGGVFGPIESFCWTPPDGGSP